MVAACWCLWPSRAEADLIRGLQEIVGGVLQLPISTLAGTFQGPPIVGTIVGALTGAVSGVGLVARGALDIVGSVIPLAKQAVPFLIPIFL